MDNVLPPGNLCGVSMFPFGSILLAAFFYLSEMTGRKDWHHFC
jgi:hypothetical protein